MKWRIRCFHISCNSFSMKSNISRNVITHFISTDVLHNCPSLGNFHSSILVLISERCDKSEVSSQWKWNDCGGRHTAAAWLSVAVMKRALAAGKPAVLLRSCLGGGQLQSDRWCGDMWWTENHQSYQQTGRCWWSSQIRGWARQRAEIFDTRLKRRVTPNTLITFTAVVWREWRRLRDSTCTAEKILLIWDFI